MSIPMPADLARSRVTWKLAHTTTGADLSGASGTVRFEATARAVSFSGVTVLPAPVETPVKGGVMTPVDLVVNDPAVWSWRVAPKVGITWPAFVLDVTAGGVDLAKVAVVEASTSTRLITAEQLTGMHALDGRVGKVEQAQLVIAEDLGKLGKRVETVETTVGKVRHANVSSGEGPPPDADGYPPGWRYLDETTGDLYVREA